VVLEISTFGWGHAKMEAKCRNRTTSVSDKAGPPLFLVARLDHVMRAGICKQRFPERR
jgi:hypothetical protein